MKLGGLEPAIVYTWHDCRFTSTSEGLFFEKLSGTQRFSGYADEDGARFILLAGTSVRDEKQRPYSGGGLGFGCSRNAKRSCGSDLVHRGGPRADRISLSGDRVSIRRHRTSALVAARRRQGRPAHTRAANAFE